MVVGTLYTAGRFAMYENNEDPILPIAFLLPLPFMYITCQLVYQHAKNEFLRHEFQRELIFKFRKILKEFPESILITKQCNKKIIFPFTNDKSLLKLMKTDDLPMNGKIIHKRSEDSSDFNMNLTTTDDTGNFKSVTLVNFLLDERKSAIKSDNSGNESNIVMTLNQEYIDAEQLKFIKSDDQYIKKYFTVKTKHIQWIDDVYTEHIDGILNKKNKMNHSFLHIFIDTTKTELLKTEQTLRKYQRLMISSVAHEFRNPLNAIKGNLELMQMFKIKQIEKYLKTSRNSCLMLNSYVDDILDLGRIEGKAFHLNNTEFKLDSLSKEVYELFELELKFRKIKLEIIIQDSLQNATIVIDRDRLKQVMINLVSNAIKF